MAETSSRQDAEILPTTLPPPAVPTDSPSRSARGSDRPTALYFINFPPPKLKTTKLTVMHGGVPILTDGFNADEPAHPAIPAASHVDPVAGIAGQPEDSAKQIERAQTQPPTIGQGQPTRLPFAAAKGATRSSLRPIHALGVNLSATYRDINKRHFAAVRLALHRKRSEGTEGTPHPESAAHAQSSASSIPAVADNQDCPDAAYCDRTGNFVPLVGEEIHDRFVVLEPLGSGSFGVVLRCFDQQRLELVAVKVLRADPRFTMQGRTEARILTDIAAAARPELFATGPIPTAADSRREAESRIVGADHVLKLRKAFEWRGHVCIVTELLGKSLYDLLRISHFQGVSLRLTAKFGWQLGRALRLLASLKKPVVHVDVKPENILLVDDRRSAIKVVDFGSSCYEAVPMKAQYAQSRFCRAPEVMLRLPYGCAVDTWSAATVLFEMHAGSPLFDGKSESVQLQKFQQLLGPMPPSLVRKSRKHRLFRLLRQTEAIQPTPLDDDIIAALPEVEKSPVPSADEHWFEMLSYEDAAKLPGQVAEQDEAILAHWDEIRPISIVEAASRIKTDLLRKRLANFRRAERRRGDSGKGNPVPESPRHVDLMCLMLARMLRYDPDNRAHVNTWSTDAALTSAVEQAAASA
jgi:serine/threonine protein kinase